MSAFARYAQQDDRVSGDKDTDMVVDAAVTGALGNLSDVDNSGR
jgi:hypothetical protein